MIIKQYKDAEHVGEDDFSGFFAKINEKISMSIWRADEEEWFAVILAIPT